MKRSKKERRALVAAAMRKKSEDRIHECVLATASMDRSKTCFPPANPYGRAELGNSDLMIERGERMVIFDRLMLKGRVRLHPENCVVMDEFGGDFHTECFERRRSMLVIPIGHMRQDLWPDKVRFKPTFSVGTDIGSLAFLSSISVPESLLGSGTAWKCSAGLYRFRYEEIADLRSMKQALARNIIVAKSS